jgi:hypothetical protein
MGLIRKAGAASAVVAVGIVLSALPARGAVIADFSGGTGTASSDQYRGKSGDGWASAWIETSDSAIDGAVLSTTPLNGGGNYLQATLGNVAVATHSVARSMTHPTGVNLNQWYRIEFDFRFDTPLSTFTNVDDMIRLADRGGPTTDAGSTSRFLITAFGADNGAAVARQWAWFHGRARGSSSIETSRYVDSGLALVSGTVYSFVIDVDPATMTYRSTISNGTTTVESPVLAWHADETAVPSTLIFAARQNTSTDHFTFSIDSIRVSTPEPGAAAAVALAAGAALMGRRRRG